MPAVSLEIQLGDPQDRQNRMMTWIGWKQWKQSKRLRYTREKDELMGTGVMVLCVAVTKIELPVN